MIKPIVALIHATRNAIEPINEVFTAQLAQAEFLNFLDEAMLRFSKTGSSLRVFPKRRAAG